MKKLRLLILMLLSMFLLIGCSMEENVPQDADIYGYLSYDWNSMTFTNLAQEDVLNQVGNPYDDFVILHQEIMDQSFTPAEEDAYASLLSNMTELSASEHISMATILAYSSAEFRDVLEIYSIQLTLDDIVTFNTLKSLVEEIKTKMNDTVLYLSKINYIGYRLSITLDDADVRALNMLQEYYTELVAFDPSIQILNLTFEALMIEFEQIGFIPSIEVRTQIEFAFEIINDLATE